MVPVARRNLFAEKGRFAISVGGVAFAALLVLVVLALYRGFARTGETFELLPGQLWLSQQGTTDPFHSLSLVQQSDLIAASQAPDVQFVAPVLVRQMSFSAGQRTVAARVMAVGIPSYARVSDKIRAGYFPRSGEMVIDAILAAKQDLHEGEKVQLNGVDLTIDKIQPRSAEAFQPFAFVSYEDAERIFGVQGIVNFGMVVLQPGANVADTAMGIGRALPGLEVSTKQEFAQAIRAEIDNTFLPIIGIILAIGFTVGGAVVGLTLYTATIERSREFGVMKAVGASGGFLYRIVISQSIVLTVTGFLLGVASALLVARLAQQAQPDFSTQFLLTDILLVFLATSLMAFLAALLPARRLNGIDPAMVFKA
jgi:putative ABC transport system permease protein